MRDVCAITLRQDPCSEVQRPSGEEMMLKMNKMDNVGTPKLFQEQQKAEQDFAAKELANKQAILAFEKEAAALKLMF